MILLLHILAATIWTGGHLMLAIVILPRVLSEISPSELLRFKSGYERIGIPALLIQVATGIWLAYRIIPDLSQWFVVDDPVSRLIIVKLVLLAATIGLAANAWLRIISNLCEKAWFLWHGTSFPLQYCPCFLLSRVFLLEQVFYNAWNII